MPRTTLTIDATVLAELKRLGRTEGKTAGQVASELLARTLAETASARLEPLSWTAKPMGARVDLDDKDALNAVLDAR